MVMVIRTSWLCAAAAIGLATQPALAQRSLFDQPLAQEPPPAPAPPPAAAPRPATPPASAPPPAPVAQAPQPAPAPVPQRQVQAQAPAPAATPAEPAPKPKPKRSKPSGPVPARALTINNASPNILVSLEVSGEGKSAKLAKPLPPKKKATLKLPAFKECTVSVAASFEGQAQAGANEVDICKEKQVRFTE